MSGSPDTFSPSFVRDIVLNSASGFVIGMHLFVSYGTTFDNAVFSGIVVNVDGHALWVTSGHCIDVIRKAITAETMFSWNAGLLDGYDDYPAVRLPLLLTEDRLIGCDSGDIDVGAIRLSGLTMRGLAHNATFQLAPLDPMPRALTSTDSLYLLGYQASFNSPDLTGNESTTDPDGLRVNRMTFRLVPARSGIPLQPASAERARDSFAVQRDAPAFDLMLGPDVFPDIAGMSGGPIVRLPGQDGSRLSVLAVQSEWNTQARVIRADRIDVALDFLRSTLMNLGLEPLP